MPYKIYKRGDQYCVYKLDADGNPEGKPEKCHYTRADAVSHMKALYVNVEDAREIELTDEEKAIIGIAESNGGPPVSLSSVTISEFKGKPPMIPVAPGVDMDALTDGDDDPMFVTLPVGARNAVSGNGLVWDDSLVTSVLEQINGKRPSGIMGHIREGEESTAFPMPVVHWIGAQLLGDLLWAKGYVVPGPAREFVRRMKALGGKIATSIYGSGKKVPIDGDDTKYRVEQFNLEQVDLAPWERAALKLSGEFMVTAEMQGSSNYIATNNVEVTDMGTKDEIIAQLQVADIPDGIRKAIVAEYEKANEIVALRESAAKMDQVVSELTEAKSRIAELEASVKELTDKATEAEAEKAKAEAAIAEYQKNEFDLAFKALVAEQVELEPLRPIVERVVLAQMGERDAEKAKELLKEYLESDEYKAIAEAMVVSIGGPRATGGSRDNRGTGTWTLEDTEEARRAARNRVGL